MYVIIIDYGGDLKDSPSLGGIYVSLQEAQDSIFRMYIKRTQFHKEIIKLIRQIKVDDYFDICEENYDFSLSLADNLWKNYSYLNHEDYERCYIRYYDPKVLQLDKHMGSDYRPGLVQAWKTKSWNNIKQDFFAQVSTPQKNNYFTFCKWLFIKLGPPLGGAPSFRRINHHNSGDDENDSLWRELVLRSSFMAYSVDHTPVRVLKALRR